MSAKQPTDKQFVDWWIHRCLGRGRNLYPEDWEHLVEEIEGRFELKLSEKRAVRLWELISNETESLIEVYRRKAKRILT